MCRKYVETRDRADMVFMVRKLAGKVCLCIHSTEGQNSKFSPSISASLKFVTYHLLQFVTHKILHT